jgi:hypothetical protein
VKQKRLKRLRLRVGRHHPLTSHKGDSPTTAVPKRSSLRQHTTGSAPRASFIVSATVQLMVTLTPERIFEAAPIHPYRREQLQWLQDEHPSEHVSVTVLMDSWWYLIKWYRLEAREIGEERAFWGLVYRLLDEPTDDDVQCVLA